MIYVTRKAHFSAAHRLYNPTFSDERNEAVFDKCNNPHGHGHNYTLEVTVAGIPDPLTGYVIDLKILKDIIEEEVIQHFDHQNLNMDVAEFKNLNPTVENIAVVIHDLIRKRLDEKYDLQVKLYETERNFVEYPV